jgi:hypothetical protein
MVHDDNTTSEISWKSAMNTLIIRRSWNCSIMKPAAARAFTYNKHGKSKGAHENHGNIVVNIIGWINYNK